MWKEQKKWHTRRSWVRHWWIMTMVMDASSPLCKCTQPLNIIDLLNDDGGDQKMTAEVWLRYPSMKNPICQATINPTLLLGVQGTPREVVVTMKEAVAVEEEDLVVRCNLTVKQISLVHLYIQPFFAFCCTSLATL